MARVDPELARNLASGGTSARTAFIHLTPGTDAQEVLRRVQALTGLAPVQGSYQPDAHGFSLLAPPEFLIVLASQPEVVSAEAMRRSGGRTG